MWVLLCVLLVACGVEPTLSELELKNRAEKSAQSKRYSGAAQDYFSLWCNYPEKNLNALLQAAKMHAIAGDLTEALELADDYYMLNGDADGEVYLIKALAYYSQVKSPLKNIDKAEAALVNLAEYAKFKEPNQEVKDMRNFLENMVVFSKLREVRWCLENKPASVLVARNKAKEALTKWPNHTYAPHFKEIIARVDQSLGI